MPCPRRPVKSVKQRTQVNVMFREAKTGWIFVLPAFLLLCLFKITPIVVSFAESLQFTGITGEKSFVGLENYLFLFTDDPVFWNSVKVTLVYSLIVNPAIVITALILAMLVNVRNKFAVFFRTLYFIPAAISFAVVSVIWGVVLDPYYGLANGFLALVRIPPQPFFASSGQALPSLVFLILWRSAGYWMIFFLAGLQGIPKEVYEAAEIDGVTYLQRTFRITIPLLSRTISFVLVTNTALNFLTFAPVYILTNGGPCGATNILMYESYKSAFVNLDLGRATAISSVLLLIILLFSAVELKLTRASFEY
jgi:multiple sugar transport system permease protein